MKWLLLTLNIGNKLDKFYGFSIWKLILFKKILSLILLKILVNKLIEVYIGLPKYQKLYY